MLFNNVNSIQYESTLLKARDDSFSIREIGTLRFENAAVQIKAQGKNDCLLLYLRSGHAIVKHAKSEKVILSNELVFLPLENGVHFLYAQGSGDFLVGTNCSQSELMRNHLRVPSEVEPRHFDEFLLSASDPLNTESLSKLLKTLPVNTGRDAKQREFIRNALLFMDKNMSKRIVLDDITDTIDYSKFHFIRVFDEYIGQTPHQYICDRRLFLARELLAQTDLPIAEVAMRSGIRFTSNFYSHFKRKFKKTPKDYRDQSE
jgi:AraC-like DNA-binding protein